MAVGATMVLLALWMAFIWFADPDGMRGPEMHAIKVGAAAQG